MAGSGGRGNPFSVKARKAKGLPDDPGATPQGPTPDPWAVNVPGGGQADAAPDLQGNIPVVSNGKVIGYVGATGNPKPPNYTAQGGGGDPAAPAPTYDPLALQQMWANVFGPIFNQTAKMMGNIGPDYLTAMTQAIGGSNQSAAAKAQQLGNAKAMSDLLNQYGQSNLQQVATGPTLDTLLGWLQQATGAAQQAQGVAEKNIAYGGSVLNAQALGVNSPATTGATSGAGTTLSPQQAAALTQSALSGNQTGNATAPGASSNPLNPSQLLSAQGLSNPAGYTTP